MNEKEPVFVHNPLEKASFFSRITFSWISPLLSLGRKKQLLMNDLYSPVSEDEARPLIDQLESKWDQDFKDKGDKASIVKTIIKLYGLSLLVNSIYIIIEEIIKIFQPLFISMVILYFNGGIKRTEALVYAAVISICAVIGGVLHHPYFFNSWRIGMKIRIACSGLIYRKIFKLNINSLDSNSAGDVINLLSTDVTRIEISVLYLPFLFIGFFQMLIVIAIVLIKIGPYFLTGLLLLLAIIPAQILLAKCYNKYRAKICKKSDKRISLLTEILNSIKIIKMYCWEIPFTERVTKTRNEELYFQACLNVLQAASASIDTVMATVMTFINISCFMQFTSAPLIPSFVVFSIGFYMRLCNTIGYNFTRSITTLINGLVSAKRVNNFLLRKELSVSGADSNRKTPGIRVSNLNFSWNNQKETTETTTTKTKKESFKLKNVSFEAKSGQLVTIIGPIGSGKSTLLLSILGELENYTGNVAVNGKVCYIAQQPWVFTATIRQNILFGNSYDKEKFDRVVEVCSLKKDLELLPFGENTLIGEKGMNLSGGQRARICMARALYTDADIYLFDDSLSAVDSNVGRFILNNCINGYLKPKIRILVTHHVQHLETSNHVIILKNGKVECQGKYDEIKKIKEDELRSIAEEEEILGEDEVLKSVQKPPLEITAKIVDEDLKAKEDFCRSEREELQQKGSVSWKAYYTYFMSGGGILGTLLVFLLFLSAQAMIVATDYWLFIWATNEENHKIRVDQAKKFLSNKNETVSDFLPDNSSFTLKSSIFLVENPVYYDRARSYKIYLILSSVSVLLVIIRSIFYFLLCVRCSKTIYERLFLSVRNTSIRFFELNPIGRIVNRFTRDTNNMDDLLTSHLYEFLQVSMVIFGALLIPIIVKYWMALPLIPLGICFFMIKSYFVPSARELKRLDNIARSPIFVHTNSTIEGILTIRAAGKEEILCREFEMHNNNHTRAFFAFLAAHRWFGIRLDFLCSIYTLTTLFACIFFKDYLGLSTGKIGLVMCYLLQLFDLFQWCVVLNTYVENLMTSIERIMEYTQLPNEPLYSGKEYPPDDWPSKGLIKYEDVSLGYDKNLPNVLKNISLQINSSEKVGIIGRTGAGKSSFFQTLFRMYEPSGSILVDGVDIKNLSLHDLRSKLTIIPQEPILFYGTIRFNLDPFKKYDDLEIWEALQSVNLKLFVQELNGRLESNISGGGANLSVGQKQLFCLARAILKKTKILVIDEATANVDFKTDAFIQKTIREQFKQCTVLTIAHRLATVVDNDKLLCLSEGEVKNFDKPTTLLEDHESILYELVSKMSQNERNQIYDIIEKAREKSKLAKKRRKKLEAESSTTNTSATTTSESEGMHEIELSDEDDDGNGSLSLNESDSILRSHVNYGATLNDEVVVVSEEKTTL